MVLVDSHGISRVPRYSGTQREPIRFHLPGYHRLWPTFPGRSISKLVGNSLPLKAVRPYNPTVQARWFGLYPRSLAATSGITVVFSSSRYGDGSLPSVSSFCPMNSGSSILGSPIRKSTGQWICAPHRCLSQLFTSFIAF